jgi:hypothetical protein
MKRRWTDTLTSTLLDLLCYESSLLTLFPTPFCSLNTNPLSYTLYQKRLDKFGANSLDEEENKSLFAMVLEQFDDPMVKILLTAAGISFVIALFEDEKEGISRLLSCICLSFALPEFLPSLVLPLVSLVFRRLSFLVFRRLSFLVCLVWACLVLTLDLFYLSGQASTSIFF